VTPPPPEAHADCVRDVDWAREAAVSSSWAASRSLLASAESLALAPASSRHRSAVNQTHRHYTRSTQPCIPPGSLNRVPASAGVRAGMSPLPGGR